MTVPDEDIRPREQRLAQRDGAVDLRAVGEHAGRVDRSDPSLVCVLPLTDGVEVLEREADRIDVAMARRAHRVGAMQFELLADG